MSHNQPVLVILLELVDLFFAYASVPAPAPRRGRPVVYSEALIVKALVVMLVRHLQSPYALDAYLPMQTTAVQQLHPYLSLPNGQRPTRRTWERRMGQLPQRLPTLIACLGRQLPVLLQPWQQGDQEYGHTTAIDTTPIKARGVWHSKDKQAGIAPSTAIDTEAGWSRSQYHGWWWGYKLHLLVTAAPHWLPLGADLTPANVGDNTHARRLLQGPLQDLPGEVRIMLGDQLYNDKQLRTLCADRNIDLVTTRRNQGSKQYPHTDGGVDVRRVLHALRSQTIEPVNAQFKKVFDCITQAPARGLKRNQLLILGAVFVFQLLLLLQWFDNRPVGTGVKALFLAA
jgi:hypothetical protein